MLKKLCAALIRSFRGQHSKKMKGNARGNWDPREGQQPFRPNPNRVGDSTTTFRRLLIGASFYKTKSATLQSKLTKSLNFDSENNINPIF